MRPKGRGARTKGARERDGQRKNARRTVKAAREEGALRRCGHFLFVLRKVKRIKNKKLKGVWLKLNIFLKNSQNTPCKTTIWFHFMLQTITAWTGSSARNPSDKEDHAEGDQGGGKK